MLMESIRLEISFAGVLDWGTYAAVPAGSPSISDLKMHTSMVRIDGRVERAMIQSIGGLAYVPTYDFSHFSTSVSANAGAINYQIPARASNVSYIVISLTPNTVLSQRDQRKITTRTKAGMTSYRFRLGTQNFPQSDVVTTGSGAWRAWSSTGASAVCRTLRCAARFLRRSTRMMAFASG
jgi:hypothetical protein